MKIKEQISKFKARSRDIFSFCFALCSLPAQHSRKTIIHATTNLNLWNEKKIENYSFSFKRICFCPLEYVGPQQVVVQNGKVVTVNGAAYNSSQRYGVIPTIPELLLTIKSHIDKNPVKKTLNFNSTYGYPTSVFFDFSELMADDELGYEVTNFKVN
ncbi:MAG: DUF6174 domain-containing protein [Cytophagales bacterium]|nr:DUF6174 domain-containing protein [Cytophagales bacterium]